MHNSTPLSLDRFELEKRISQLYYNEKQYDGPLHVLDDVMDIIGRMAEEGDAMAAQMEDCRDIPEYGDADSNVGDE